MCRLESASPLRAPGVSSSIHDAAITLTKVHRPYTVAYLNVIKDSRWVGCRNRYGTGLVRQRSSLQGLPPEGSLPQLKGLTFLYQADWQKRWQVCKINIPGTQLALTGLMPS